MHSARAHAAARLITAAVAAAAAVLAVSAPSTAASPLAATGTTADSHPDPTGDAPNGAADISGVDVGNDFVTGAYVIWINLANRTAFTGGDSVLVLLDSDLNQSTGLNGFDYGIEDDAGNCVLVQAQGTDFNQVPAPTLSCDFREKSVRIEINPSDIGGAKAINFYAVTYNGDARGDDAPDSGLYSYSAGSGNVPLAIERFALTPAAPKAGKTLVAQALVARNDILEDLDGGTVTCTLRAGGKAVRARAGAFVDGVATCAWTVPKTAKRKPLAGSISVSFGGSKVTKTFTARAR